MDLNRGDTVGGLSVTGRKLIGPASDLVELDSDNGLRHTAVVFHAEYRGHDAIGSALDVVLGFLESPMVTGLVELVEVDREQGGFVYPTGEAWSVAEVIRMLADHGEPAGVRAGLELMYACGQILVEAADAGDSQGVYSHGGLTPWRVMLKRDGQVLVIGHALPQVEILQFHEDNRRVPREDSFRYCPPERIDAAPEDLSSDLFSLALIAFELMTGKPVYDGLVNDIRQQAARGEGSRRLFRFREVLPQSVRDVLTYALRPDREDRYPHGDDFLESVRAVLSSSDAVGASLMDVMARVSATGQRSGTALEGGKTQMLSKDQLMAMLDEEEGGAGVRSSGDGVQGRSAAATWSPPPSRGARRRPRRGQEGPEPTPPEPTEELPTPTPSASAAEPGAPAAGGASRWSKGPRRSRRASAGRDATPSTPPVDQAAPVDEAPATPVAAATTSSGDDAKDLLAWIKSSADGEPPGEGRSSGDSSAASLIEQITSSSGGGPDSPRFNKGRARRSRRTRADGPPPIPSLGGVPATTPSRPAVPDLPPTGGPVGSPSSPPAIPRVPGVASPAGPGRAGPRPVGAAASAAQAGASGPPPVLVEPPGRAKDTTQVARPEEPATTPVAAPAPAAPTAPAAPAAAFPPPSGPLPAPPTAARSPDAIPAVTTGDPVTLQLRRSPEGRALRVRLPGNTTTAEAIARMVGNVLPVRTDLSGGLAGWWRLRQGDARLPGDRPLAEVDASQPVDIVLVANRVISAEVRVAAAVPPARHLTRVGTAVPAASLCDHLAGWLCLPAGQWCLRCDGVLLAPHMVLDDLPGLSACPVLELDKAT